MITHQTIKTFFLSLTFIFPILGFGQNWNDLSPDLQSKIKLRWSQLTPATTIHLDDSSLLNGQILFPVDSGIIWRNGPQYLPYEASQVELIPYKNISIIRVNRSRRLFRHAMNGGLIGASTMSTLSYVGADVFRNMSPISWSAYTLGGFLGGAGLGTLSGAVIDYMRGYQLVDQPNRKKMRPLTFLKNTLYTYRKEDYWHKYWVENDSIIGDYALPPTLDKIKIARPGGGLTFNMSMGMRTRPNIPFLVANGSTWGPDYSYYHTPTFLDFRLAYQFNSYLKAGIHTQKVNNDSDYFRFDWGQGNLWVSGDAWQKIEYERSYGAFVEFTPFPARYLAFRRWELNLGAGVIREQGKLRRSISSYYSINDPVNNTWDSYDTSGGSSDDFSIIGANGYLGLSIYPTRNFSIQTRFGFNHLPRVTTSHFAAEIVDPFDDIIVPERPANLSHRWLTMGAELKLF